MRTTSSPFSGHCSSVSVSLRARLLRSSVWRSARRDRQTPDALEHRAEQASRQVSFCQQQPKVTSMLHESPAGLDEALLQAGERPRVDALGQHQTPPQVPEVVRQHTELQSNLVRPEPVTREPRPVRRLLAFLDPLLRRAALVVEPDDGADSEGGGSSRRSRFAPQQVGESELCVQPMARIAQVLRDEGG
jgi:hypothetical protein